MPFVHAELFHAGGDLAAFFPRALRVRRELNAVASLLLEAESLTKSIILNTKCITFNDKFVILNTNRYLACSQGLIAAPAVEPLAVVAA